MFNPWPLLRKRPALPVADAPAPVPPAGTARPARRVRGQAIPLIALMMIALIGFTGLAVDVSFLILRTLQQQRAADAAALAGVIKLPDNPSLAYSRALEYAEKNGYPNHPGGAPYPDVVALPVSGYNTRLHVTITATHEVYFMRIFGISNVLVTRDSEAVYALPVRLGSPDPYFGVGNATVVAVSNDQSLPTPGPITGGRCENCAVYNPQNFWAAIDPAGSRTGDGDAYNTRSTRGYSGGCLGSVFTTPANPFYNNGAGYNYRVGLDPGAQGPIDVYVYDPAQYYRSGTQGTDPDTNDQEPCSGYQGTHRYRYATTFTLYYPDSTPDFFGDDVPVPGGSRTFIDGGTTNYHDKWFLIGAVAYDSSRDPNPNFRLQVTTSSNDPNGGGGVGHNEYALALGGPRGPTNSEQIYGITNMSLFNNFRDIPPGSPTEWYLAYVPGEHAGERMSVRLFDPGDSQCTTYVQLIMRGNPTPVDFYLNWSGGQINTLQTSDGNGGRPYDGQWVTLGVVLPPPGQYFDTWWKVRYIVPQSCQAITTDRTVWELLMLGSPIHNVPPPPP